MGASPFEVISAGVAMSAKRTEPVAHYSSTRLHFDAATIEPLGSDDPFRVDTPHGSFQMTKAEFYETFANVVQTSSYREAGNYHYSKTPKKALRFLVAMSSTPTKSQKPASKNRQLSPTELANLFQPLLDDVRGRLRELAGDDDDLHFALRRKLFKELTYDERSKPMQRQALKRQKGLE
ncbi:MAG: hypothetical protein EOO70_08835, partial [Myxococcaceae bacterium]